MVAPGSDGSLVLHENLGAHSFGPEVRLELEAIDTDLTTSIRLGDVEADGLPDAVWVADQGDAVSRIGTARNLGGLAFARPVFSSLARAALTSELLVVPSLDGAGFSGPVSYYVERPFPQYVDWTGDGRVDLAGPGEGDRLQILPNLGGE